MPGTCADARQQVAALVYAGAALGAVFAGDLLTLFVFWELTAVSSVLLVWARGTPALLSRRHALRDHSAAVGHAAAVRCHRATTRPSGTLRFDHIGLERPGGLADLRCLRHQVRISVAAQLAAGRLPGGLGDRHGVPVGVHHQAGGVCTGARLLRHGVADSDRRRDGGLPDLLRGDRKRPAARAGLQPEQPARVHGGRHRHRHRTVAERHRRPCLRTTSCTRHCCSCRWARCCSAWAPSRAPNWGACTSRCPGPRPSASSARRRSRASRCSAASSASR